MMGDEAVSGGVKFGDNQRQLRDECEPEDRRPAAPDESGTKSRNDSHISGSPPPPQHFMSDFSLSDLSRV